MIAVNGVQYNLPDAPVIIICLDGCEPEYLEKAEENGYLPTITKFKESGFFQIADSVIPSYTNPNNIAIITGTIPKINGVPSNWILDSKNKVERSLDSSDDLKCATILQTFSEKGIKVASVTAKDKLRLLFGKGFNGINISAELANDIKDKNDTINDVIEKAIQASKSGIKPTTNEWMYSEKPSHYALELAVALVNGNGPYIPELVYVSLTDYIPHRYPPGSNEANQYFGKIDRMLNELDKVGCIIGITADHGMNDKHNPDGTPKAIWIDDILDLAGVLDYKTILPITDKYAAHHGSLGGMAWIHSKEIDKVISALSCIKGVEKILTKKEAAELFDLPPEIIGDIVLFGGKGTVFGTSKNKHSKIPSFLRSHGSLHEQKVPFIINKKLNKVYFEKAKAGLKNYQIFEYALNGVS